MKKKIFPKIGKKLKGFLTDESGKITKKDALGLAAVTSLGVAINDVVAAHTSSYTSTGGKGGGTGHSSYAHSNGLYCRATNHSSNMGHGSAIVNGSANYRFPSSKHTSSLTAGSLSGHGSASGHSSHGSSGSGTGTGGSCFTYSQRVLTPNGLKPIGSFKKGDEVISYNHNSNSYEISIVDTFIPHDGLNVYFNNYKKDALFKIFVQKEDNTIITIESTSNHPFYDASCNEYKKIRDIKIGNELILYKSKGKLIGTESLVDSSHGDDCDLPIVYNLHMRKNDNHNYFVEGVLVHNARNEIITDIP